MFDHVMLMVENKNASQDFYSRLLGELGHSLIHESDEYAGFGTKGQVPFWLKQATANGPSRKTHLAFSATSRSQVRNFFATALKLGATSNGEPGLRAEHGANTYAAYIFDLDGHNIEAVCYAKEDI